MLNIRRAAAPALGAFMDRWQAGPAIFVFLLPLILGIDAKLRHTSALFGEYHTVTCAAAKAAAGQPYYTLTLTCDGVSVPPFVYLPGVAEITAHLIKALGTASFDLLYFIVYALALAALFVLPLLALRAPGTWRQRLPFMAMFTGGAVLWGNVAVILHSGILLAALALTAAPWLLLAAIVVAAWLKPVFLAYLLVFVLADMPWQHRAGWVVAGLALGLAPTLLFVVSGSQLSHQWLIQVQHFVCDVTPGYGVLGWLKGVGIDGRSLLAQGVWAGFAGIIVMAAVFLTQAWRLSPAERLWLGLSLACLLIPRIMSQDIFLLAPGFAVLASRTRGLAAGLSGRLEAMLFRNGERFLLGLCALSLAGGLTGAGRTVTTVVIFALSLYLLAVACLWGRHLWRDRVRKAHPEAAALAAGPL